MTEINYVLYSVNSYNKAIKYLACPSLLPIPVTVIISFLSKNLDTSFLTVNGYDR